VQEAIKTRACGGFKDCSVDNLSLITEGKPEVRFSQPAKRFTVKLEPKFEEMNRSTKPDRKWRVAAQFRCNAEFTVSQRMAGSEWGLSADEAHGCAPGAATCSEPWNANTGLIGYCECLAPADHCEAVNAELRRQRENR
jgi:hypothetical protein